MILRTIIVTLTVRILDKKENASMKINVKFLIYRSFRNINNRLHKLERSIVMKSQPCCPRDNVVTFSH